MAKKNVLALLVAAASIEAQAENEERQDFLARTVRAVLALPDEKYNELPKAAQDYVETATEAMNTKSPIPEPTGKAEKPAKKSAKKAEKKSAKKAEKKAKGVKKAAKREPVKRRARGLDAPLKGHVAEFRRIVITNPELTMDEAEAAAKKKGLKISHNAVIAGYWATMQTLRILRQMGRLKD